MQPQLVWITVANVLYLISYSVRDILWLRVLTVLGAGLLIPYYWLEPGHLRAAIGWNLVFIAINVFWIVVLLLERRPVSLTPDESRLRDIAFASLTAREAKKLFALGWWDDALAGESLVERDIANNRVSVILRGSVDVTRDGKSIAALGDGQFLGAIDANAANLHLDVVATEPTRVLCWQRKSLDGFLKKRPDVAFALSRSVGREMRQLLGDALARLD